MNEQRKTESIKKAPLGVGGKTKVGIIGAGPAGHAQHDSAGGRA